MHELAERLGCHTSNATGIADRLAARGLVERTDDPADRRIKRVSLTEAGRQVRDRLVACASEHPSPIERLTADQRSQLAGLLRIAAGPLDMAQATRHAARILGVTEDA
jgi:DNA-binding MarR family transcriptional regulator